MTFIFRGFFYIFLAGQNLTLTGDKKLVTGHQKWVEGSPKNELVLGDI